MNPENVELYIEHAGTIRVAGRTDPKTSAYYAYVMLGHGYENIDFFYIGANAGQQAMKAMTIFAQMVRNETSQEVSLSFEPLRYATDTEDEKGKHRKDATVWRTVLTGTLPVKFYETRQQLDPRN